MVSTNFYLDKDLLYKKTIKALEDNIFFNFDYSSINLAMIREDIPTRELIDSLDYNDLTKAKLKQMFSFFSDMFEEVFHYEENNDKDNLSDSYEESKITNKNAIFIKQILMHLSKSKDSFQERVNFLRESLYLRYNSKTQQLNLKNSVLFLTFYSLYGLGFGIIMFGIGLLADDCEKFEQEYFVEGKSKKFGDICLDDSIDSYLRLIINPYCSQDDTEKLFLKSLIRQLLKKSNERFYQSFINNENEFLSEFGSYSNSSEEEEDDSEANNENPAKSKKAKFSPFVSIQEQELDDFIIWLASNANFEFCLDVLFKMNKSD